MKFPRTDTDIDYFSLRVSLDETTGCWNWIGSISKLKGYGKAHMKPATSLDAHVMAFLIFVGPIPDGKELHHKCRNRRCANPYHLEPRTHQEHCAIDFAVTHCPNGHEFVEGSYYLVKGGRGTISKACKQCAKARANAHYAANKERHLELMRANYLANRELRLAQMKARNHALKLLTIN